MTTHKCDGCRYKGEHHEMGFKPFGVCYKETNLIEAEKNYNAETCPYSQKFIEAAREFRGEGNPAYLPQLFKTDPEPEAEPEQWPKENPYTKPAIDISINFEPIKKGLQAVASAVDTLTENLKLILKEAADLAKKIKLYPNKRVVYLTTHGKHRMRKKNINRIIKWYERQGKKAT